MISPVESSATDLPDPACIHSIACLMLGEIGDLIVVLPTVEALRSRYPDATITLLLRSHLCDLVRDHPAIDERLELHGKSFAAKVRFALAIGRRHWDLWVDLHAPTFNTISTNREVFVRNSRLLKLARCPYRLGFAVPELAAVLTHPVPVPAPEVLARENIAVTTGRLVGQRPVRKSLFLRVDENRSGRFPPSDGEARRPIALFFGAKQAAKVWPHECLVEFLTALPDHFPSQQFVLIGGPSEASQVLRLRNDGILGRVPQVQDASGNSSLAATMAILRRCRAAVMTDSGPMHMAEALGVPLVALFSAHNHPVWHPLAESAIVLREETDCAPCFLATCPRQNLCMDRIRPDVVLAALASLLARQPE